MTITMMRDGKQIEVKWNYKVYGANIIYLNEKKNSFDVAVNHGLLDCWMASMLVRDRLTFDEVQDKFRFVCYEDNNFAVNNRISYIRSLPVEAIKSMLNQEDLDFYFMEDEDGEL
jgi:hypothetical protein